MEYWGKKNYLKKKQIFWLIVPEDSQYGEEDMAAEVKKGKLHFVQTQEIKKGRNNLKWSESINPQSLALLTYFFQRGYTPKCSITSPNSITNCGQTFKYMSLWKTFLI